MVEERWEWGFKSCSAFKLPHIQNLDETDALRATPGALRLALYTACLTEWCFYDANMTHRDAVGGLRLE